MSVFKPRSQGKGDRRSDNFSKFNQNFPNLKADKPYAGEVFLKKNNKTTVIYKST